MTHGNWEMMLTVLTAALIAVGVGGLGLWLYVGWEEKRQDRRRRER